MREPGGDPAFETDDDRRADDEMNAHLRQLAASIDAVPADDIAERAAAHQRQNRAMRAIGIAATLALVVVLGAIAVRAGTTEDTEVVSGPPPGTAESTVATPPTAPVDEAGDAVLARGTDAGLDWSIVRSPAEPATGTCWRLDGPALGQGRTASCGFGVPPQPLGVQIDHTAEHALVWGPVLEDVARVHVRLAGGETLEAALVQAVDGTQRFYVVATPNGVVIDSVVANIGDGSVASLAIGSAPCPCPPPVEGVDVGNPVLPTASDEAGNPTAWATLDELADP